MPRDLRGLGEGEERGGEAGAAGPQQLCGWREGEGDTDRDGVRGELREGELVEKAEEG